MRKMKKIFAVALALTMSLMMFAGCGSNKDADTNKEPGTNQEQPSDSKAESGKIKEIHEAVKAAYGETYLPNMPVDETMLSEKFGVSKDLVKEYVAEIPMISVNIDTFVGIEAAEGKAEEVEAALNKYREAMLADTMQYPMNVPKIQASKVLKVDDYVFFILLGDIPLEILDTEDEAKIKDAADKEVQKAVDAINKTLGK